MEYEVAHYSVTCSLAMPMSTRAPDIFALMCFSNARLANAAETNRSNAMPNSA